MVDPTEEDELEGSKGTCNFHLKWEGSKKASYCNFVANKQVKTEYTEEDARTWVAIAAWDCRGLEPVNWHVDRAQFVASGMEGAEFEFEGSAVEFEDGAGEWYDYDEDAAVPVSITQLQWKFEAIPDK
eukprot:TRINITY_DN4725_c0_g1_i3.p1 TRINITY_DN4725_c0_g1~~TRINITY_DN4725_c0_g1_i3.p1  ORF type:complete len:128 (+),score=30.62 TRINITY_DN4725_c0_g1_i3:164-547(+)